MAPAHTIHIPRIPARGFNFGIYPTVALLADRFVQDLDSVEQARSRLALGARIEIEFSGVAAPARLRVASGNARCRLFSPGSNAPALVVAVIIVMLAGMTPTGDVSRWIGGG